jgi:hypothetical protein
MQALALCVALALSAPIGTIAYREGRAGARVKLTRFDFRAEAVKCLSDAATTASKFPDAAAGATAVVRIADSAWKIDKVFARTLFEQAFALADGESGYAGARGRAGRAARALAIRLYGKRDFERANQLAAQPIEPKDADATAIADPKGRAELLADLAEQAFATNEPASFDLALRSLETGYVEPPVPRILSSYFLKDPFPRRNSRVADVFNKALEVASTGEHASYTALARMNAELSFLPAHRGGFAPRAYGSVSWLNALDAYLRRAYKELAAAKAQERGSTLLPGDLELLARDQSMIEEETSRWSGGWQSLRTLLKRVTAAAPKPSDAELHDRRLYSSALDLPPPEIREIAEKVFDPRLRDALLVIAADKIVKLTKELPIEKKPAKDGPVEERKDPAREYLDAIVDDRVRAAAEDHVLIATATTMARKTSEVEASLAKVSALDLRVQAYGVVAIRFAEQSKSDDAVAFAEKARRGAETAPRTVRTIQGLCLAAIARQAVGDKGAVPAISDLLFVYDRLSDEAEPPLPISSDAIGHLIPLESSPFKVPQLDQVPLAKALAALAHRDPLGARPVANTVETTERRVDALIAAATALVVEGKRRTRTGKTATGGSEVRP